MKAQELRTAWSGRVLLAALLLTVAVPCRAQSRQSDLVGKPAPSFQLQGVYGEPYSLEKFKGHILVMQFGSSW
jgi:hypothetical protein